MTKFDLLFVLFVIRLASHVSAWSIFSKNQVLYHLFFCSLSFFSFPSISYLNFYLFLLFLTLGLIDFPSSISQMYNLHPFPFTVKRIQCYGVPNMSSFSWISFILIFKIFSWSLYFLISFVFLLYLCIIWKCSIQFPKVEDIQDPFLSLSCSLILCLENVSCIIWIFLILQKLVFMVHKRALFDCFICS